MADYHHVDGAVHSGAYALEFLDAWGSTWNIKPKSIGPGESTSFQFISSGRGGFWFRAVNADGSEAGFVAMSFRTPLVGTASAEGSNAKTPRMLDAGLQPYFSHNHLALRFNVGTPNKACWGSRDSYDGDDVTCGETRLDNVRAFIAVENTTTDPLSLLKYWNRNSNGAENWIGAPSTATLPPPGKTRTFLLTDNDRAGMWLKSPDYQYNLSFSCRKSSPNAAEGSRFAGLQTYARHGTPVSYRYKVGTENLACWGDADKDDGTLDCVESRVASQETEYWMGLVNAQNVGFGDKALHEVAFPGSHDSACFDMPFYAAPMGQTQALSFEQQLRLGIRYFDLRLKYVGGNQESLRAHKFHHGNWETNVFLDALVKDIDLFYRQDWAARQHEVLLLDFTHFYLYDATGYTALAQALKASALEKYLVKTMRSASAGDDHWPVKLSDIWGGAGKRRVIASISGNPATLITDDAARPYLWRGGSIYATGWSGTTFWPNTGDRAKLQSFLQERLDAAPYSTRLWVLQDIIPFGTGGSVRMQAPVAASVLKDGGLTDLDEKANIVMQDFVSPGFVQQVIDMNVKRLN